MRHDTLKLVFGVQGPPGPGSGTGSGTGGTFPFYKSDGTRDDIDITPLNELPFFKSNGAQDNISLVV